ncbi:MAG TPA: HigA family addiction module antitoxin [Steroidobacteraceae bacterium]
MMFNPPHPGEVLADTVLRVMTVTAFAAQLKMTRAAVSRVIHGHAGISAEMALRLGDALGVSAESWIGMQADYDLWQAKKKHRVKVQRIKEAA